MNARGIESTLNDHREDVVSEYRNRVLNVFGIVCMAFAVPFTILNLWQGHLAIGVAAFCLFVVSIANAYAIRANRAPEIIMAIFLVSLMTVIGISLVDLRAFGVFWSYPGILFIYFGVSRKLARIYSTILFVYVAILVISLQPIDFSIRVVSSLFATLVFTNVFMKIIEELQTKLVEQAEIDPLTGANNRRNLMTMLQEAVERKRRRNSSSSILVLDIDDFKSLNDRFGHDGGDQVLVTFVGLLKARLRKFDQIFRTGGEEFIVYLPDTPLSGAIKLAEELRALTSSRNMLMDRTVTVSIGVSELGKHQSVQDWINAADSALYLAKREGKDKVIVADSAAVESQTV